MSTAVPKPPREDEWYKAPPNFAAATPGSVLRIRVAPGNLTKIFPSTATVYNILFRTTDTHYQPSWAVTTLFVPQESRGHALLSHQIPYNTADVNSSPSAFMHRIGDDYWPEVVKVVEYAMNRGWYLNLPDHEGPLAAVADGVTAGHATLDAIRAVLNASLGLQANDQVRVGLWGFSGGAVASGWAAELQGHYAPELKCAGAALGGLPPKLDNLGIYNSTPVAGLVPTLLCGMTAQHPSAFDFLVSCVKDEFKDAFLEARSLDIPQVFAKYAGQDIFNYFKNGREVLKSPVIVRLFQQRSVMGLHGIPQMPLYFYKSIHDEMTPIEDTDELVKKWGQAGVNILYERNTVNSHLEEAHAGSPRALEWLCKILDGEYSHTGCTITDVTIPVTA